MADMNSLLGNSEAYYDPSADAPSMVPEGMYKAYAKTLKEREVIVRNKFVADVFDLEFELAEDNSGDTVEFKGNHIEKGKFSGKTVKSKGFFRFKKPDPNNPNHKGKEENSGSNKSYMELLHSFAVKTEEDKEGRYFLPHINESDVVGMPVIIEVKHESWTDREGEPRVTPKAFSIFTWEDGVRKEEEVPF